MRTENINDRFFAAKIKTLYRTEEKPVSNENGKDVLKPLEKDTITFTRKEESEKKLKDKKRPAFFNSVFLNLGQKRVQSLEAQAKEVKEDAQDALGFSYVGSIMSHSREIITDGVETNGDTKTTAQIYNYRDGELIKAELGIEENLKTGTINTKQIFEFKKGKLSAVYENVTVLKDGTKDYRRKYRTDEEGHLHCVYNKIF